MAKVANSLSVATFDLRTVVLATLIGIIASDSATRAGQVPGDRVALTPTILGRVGHGICATNLTAPIRLRPNRLRA